MLPEEDPDTFNDEYDVEVEFNVVVPLLVKSPPTVNEEPAAIVKVLSTVIFDDEIGSLSVSTMEIFSEELGTPASQFWKSSQLVLLWKYYLAKREWFIFLNYLRQELRELKML